MAKSIKKHHDYIEKITSDKNYVGIKSWTLSPSRIREFDLYIFHYDHYNIPRYVLYRGKTMVLTHSQIKRVETLSQKLYVKRKEYKKYLQHVERHLHEILGKHTPDLKDQDKQELVYETAVNLTVDLLDDPRAGTNINRASNFVQNLITYITKRPDTAFSLIDVLSIDYYTYTHSVNVAVLSLLFGSYIGLEETRLKNLGIGAILHDIGKIKVGELILKKRAPLNEEEWEIMRKHPEFGLEVLKDKQIPESAAKVILQHHERCNGTGYPYGITAKDLHFFSKIAMIMDTFDALTTIRPYQQAYSPYEALIRMRELQAEYKIRIAKRQAGLGIQNDFNIDDSFDPALFEQFVLFLGPKGRYDRLSKSQKKDNINFLVKTSKIGT